MKRKVLSLQQVQQIISLRQGDTSWLRIQHETGIPRRVAKRTYEEWEQSQSLEELKAVRKDVITEELRKHLKLVVDFAEVLIDHLGMPKSPNEMRNAVEVFDQLWQADIYQELKDHHLNQMVMSRIQRRILRQNHMLFKSLQDHTGGKVRWEVLNEWKESWDNCIVILAHLHRKAEELVGNFFNQDKALKDKIEKDTKKNDAVARIVEGILRAIWLSNTVSEDSKGHPSFRTIPGGKGFKITIDQTGPSLQLTFIDKELAEAVTKVGNNVVRIMYCEETPRQLREALQKIGGKVDELEEMLDPLRLRPLILRTRCDICPA